MDDDNAISVKAVLLGEPAVGKTCIISRFIHDTYEINGNSTTAATCAGKTMTFEEFNGKCIKFEIWDTAGQEKYRSLTKIFYKDAKAAILVYDITRKSSFDEIKNYWYNQLKDFAPKNKFLFELCDYLLFYFLVFFFLNDNMIYLIVIQEVI